MCALALWGMVIMSHSGRGNVKCKSRKTKGFSLMLDETRGGLELRLILDVCGMQGHCFDQSRQLVMGNCRC